MRVESRSRSRVIMVTVNDSELLTLAHLDCPGIKAYNELCCFVVAACMTVMNVIGLVNV